MPLIFILVGLLQFTPNKICNFCYLCAGSRPCNAPWGNGSGQTRLTFLFYLKFQCFSRSMNLALAADKILLPQYYADRVVKRQINSTQCTFKPTDTVLMEYDRSEQNVVQNIHDKCIYHKKTTTNMFHSTDEALILPPRWLAINKQTKKPSCSEVTFIYRIAI